MPGTEGDAAPQEQLSYDTPGQPEQQETPHQTDDPEPRQTDTDEDSRPDTPAAPETDHAAPDQPDTTAPTEPIIYPDGVPVPDGSTSEELLFTSSIVNGETVSSPLYSFTVTHLKKELTLRALNVTLNGSDIPQFSGSLTLSHGANRIRISCTYADKNGEIKRAYKDYTVYYENSGKVLITTDLVPGTVTSSYIRFSASAKRGDEDIPVSVYLNGEELPGSGDYSACLPEGESLVRITAGGEERVIPLTYVPQTLRIETDLYDMTVYGQDFTFTARAAGPDDARLTVSVNGITLRGDGSYSCTLGYGTNTVRLTAKSGSERIEESYTVTCLPEYSEEELPTLTSVNVWDGMELRGSALTLTLTAQDMYGSRLTVGSIYVALNGREVSRAWEDSIDTGYKLTLAGGENELYIRLTDREGRVREYSYRITSLTAERGQEVGRIAISAGAYTVGGGTLCESGSFPIYEGETGFDVMVRFLQENGYSVGSDGGSYISSVAKEGQFSDLAPTEEELAYLAGRGITLNGSSSPDSLGEHDFTAGSGWIFRRNGRAPSYSLGQASFNDGESVEFLFSLDYGNDL